MWWIVFFAVVAVLLLLDLGLFHRTTHELSLRESLSAVGIRVVLALLFNLGIYLGWIGNYDTPAAQHTAGIEFLTSYLVEIALSIDNVFVFALLFRYFSVPPASQQRILFWGILGALVMRAIMIFSGVALVQNLHWINYFFGAILIYGGIKMIRDDKDDIDPLRNPLVLLVKKIIPVTTELHGQKFFTKTPTGICATPLFIVLIAIEATDLVFAIDSIPAVLAITQDSFLVFTSNIFAILGLRALYFALARIIGIFRYLHYGLSAILVFIGIKLLLSNTPIQISTQQSLAVVGGLLLSSIAASTLFPKRD